MHRFQTTTVMIHDPETRLSIRMEDFNTADFQEKILSSEQHALRWLEQVAGTVYHNRQDLECEKAWVAVVRTPAAHGNAGKIIMAFGETIEEAAGAAEEEWNSLWSGLSATH